VAQKRRFDHLSSPQPDSVSTNALSNLFKLPPYGAASEEIDRMNIGERSLVEIDVEGSPALIRGPETAALTVSTPLLLLLSYIMNGVV
jgi:hypothetical protein